MNKVIFITGATGNIGGMLVTRILQDDPTSKLVLLVRGKSDYEAECRLEYSLRVLAPEIDFMRATRRLQVVCGDITQPNLGLPENTFARLTSEVTHIVHSAATTQFQLPLECARLVNVVGTENVLAFARRAYHAGSLEKAAYISTAYVCGDRGGAIQENQSATPGRFSNTYEQTKWEAEGIVQDMIGELPLTVFRPSIVVGDSETGRTLAFNVLYTPLKYIYRGLVKFLPCSPDTPLDVVPLNFVGDAIHHIFFKTSSCCGKTYHIVAGRDKSPSVGMIVNSFLEYIAARDPNKTATKVRFVPSGLGRLATLVSAGEAKKMLALLQVYEPYLTVKRSFHNSNTVAALEGSQISAPCFETYFPKLLDYCFAVDWGRQMRHAA